MKILYGLLLIFVLNVTCANASDWLEAYNPVWTEQSKNCSESMPCGGGDVGMNVWVEGNELFLYLSRSGTFDENNVFCKLGRIRLSFSPNPFKDASFKQELKLREGYVEIQTNRNGKRTTIEIWANVQTPVVEIKMYGDTPTQLSAVYETWRYEPLVWNEKGRVRASIAYRDAPMKAVIQPDTVRFEDKGVCWYHRNRDNTLFDVTVHQQHLDSVKSNLWNPLSKLTFGGYMEGEHLVPDGVTSGKYLDTAYRGYKLSSQHAYKQHHVTLTFHTAQTQTLYEWRNGLHKTRFDYAHQKKNYRNASRKWWNNFWNRSFVIINSDSATVASPSWQVGRNYNLFRYQLGCNAYGKLPTKFNGGLFTFDPSLIKSDATYTPDHRDWGGGTHTAQNQRLVYWPMLKNGDFDLMPSQLNFYLNALVNARERVRCYWGHAGACFTEQIEWFGLPMASSYGWKRSSLLHPGIQQNLWVDYEWDTVLEFCKMALDLQQYAAVDVHRYIPLVMDCLTFFDEHYQQLALQRNAKALDGEGKLILYPSTGCETYKMAYNSANTIAALKSVTSALLALPEDYLSHEQRKHWQGFLKRIPNLPFRERNGHKTLAPAVAWARINNVEIPQLYAVFPWGLYGVGCPNLQVAIDTWRYGVDNDNQKNYISWHQDAIFCARLGLTDEAKGITLQKMTDAKRKYPTFWGPGHDWVPDHNWGGSGMIGVQEMLMQTVDNKIYLLPAWPKDWDVHFKLHAPKCTTVECELKDGKVKQLLVQPKEREKDVVIM